MRRAEVATSPEIRRSSGNDAGPRSNRDVWIVVPAYNEAGIIRQVVAPLGQCGPQILVVDDGSDDRTGEIAASAGAIVIRHPINLGQGAALQTGIDFALSAGANVVVTFDADGQHRRDDIWK